MEALINNVIELVTNFGMPFGFLVVVLESIIPVLPLSVFVALNVLSFGNLKGFLISWVGTIIGCVISFCIARFFSKKLDTKVKNNEKVVMFRKKINNISFSQLVILVTIPFTPAFAINIAAGLSKIDFKKFIIALLIGKAPMIYFWCFIGTSLKDSITDPSVIAKIVFMLAIAFLISKVVNKLLNIEKK